MKRLVSLDEVKRHPLVVTFLEAADKNMEALGYTEHGHRHAGLVSNIAYNILTHLGYHTPLPELASIAGYLHDLGNMVGRANHEHTGALISFSILRELQMDPSYISQIISALGNHEEATGDPISVIAAALILADKSDVHRSRVRNPNMIMFDIHDRVNYAVKESFLRVDNKKRALVLELSIDTEISQVMEYFEIFLSRMIICRKAARFLDSHFELVINGTKLL